MGQYLQMGICYRIEIDENRLERLGVTLEKVIKELNESLDLSLYELNEFQDEIIFEMKESVILEQLQDFMQFLYSLYPQEKPYIDCFKSAIEKIDGLMSLKEIVQVAEGGSFPCFQSNVITDEIMLLPPWGDWLEIDITMFVLFAEGKIIMEGYNSFLRFIENIARESSERWPIAGAFKCYID